MKGTGLTSCLDSVIILCIAQSRTYHSHHRKAQEQLCLRWHMANLYMEAVFMKGISWQVNSLCLKDSQTAAVALHCLKLAGQKCSAVARNVWQRVVYFFILTFYLQTNAYVLSIQYLSQLILDRVPVGDGAYSGWHGEGGGIILDWPSARHKVTNNHKHSHSSLQAVRSLHWR